jgi:uncharacterized protein DUF4214
VRRRVFGVLVAVALVAVGVVEAGRPGDAGAAVSGVPAQLVAKLYSEALGRAPDPAGWASALTHFRSAGCTNASVGQMVRAFYTSPEYLSRPYDADARVLTLYRGALNREPDQGGLDSWASWLRRGGSWSGAVDAFAASAELANLVPTICAAGTTTYYYGTTPAPTLPISGPGVAVGNGQQLQIMLDATPPGGTVSLAQKTVVRLAEPLIIPAGVRLTTTGAPLPTAYALQARLVRANRFDAAMVQLRDGAALANVWVDGQRGGYANYSRSAINVQLFGGDGTRVVDSKLSNSSGWTTLQAYGSHEGLPCAGNTIARNLVTAYSSDHAPHPGGGFWTDGLSIGCEHATVRHNAVVDATDVAIVVFRATPANQASVVSDNQILSAGNSAYGAIGTDTGFDSGARPGFIGTAFLRNTMWTSPDTHFDIGLIVGARMWWGNRGDTGSGAAFNDNTTGGQTANVVTGIAVSGMLHATVQRNDMRFVPGPFGRCPQVAIGVDADGFAAGGDIQPGGVPVHFVDPATGAGCVGH